MRIYSKYHNEDASIKQCVACEFVPKYNKKTSAIYNHLQMKHPRPTANANRNVRATKQRTVWRQTSSHLALVHPSNVDAPVLFSSANQKHEMVDIISEQDNDRE